MIFLIANQFLEYFHKFDNFTNASDSWDEVEEGTSTSGYLQYWECEGYELLNFKDHGFKIVFDFITVIFHLKFKFKF
jgi:hypothetical protein